MELDLRLGFDLCDEERQFLNKRKPVVSKALQRVLGLRKAPDSDQVGAHGLVPSLSLSPGRTEKNKT